MKRNFENPQIHINMFSKRDAVTTASDLLASSAYEETVKNIVGAGKLVDSEDYIISFKY